MEYIFESSIISHHWEAQVVEICCRNVDIAKPEHAESSVTILRGYEKTPHISFDEFCNNIMSYTNIYMSHEYMHFTTPLEFEDLHR